jgi:hypothetical protein
VFAFFALAAAVHFGAKKWVWIAAPILTFALAFIALKFEILPLMLILIGILALLILYLNINDFFKKH